MKERQEDEGRKEGKPASKKVVRSKEGRHEDEGRERQGREGTGTFGLPIINVYTIILAL